MKKISTLACMSCLGLTFLNNAQQEIRKITFNNDDGDGLHWSDTVDLLYNGKHTVFNLEDELPKAHDIRQYCGGVALAQSWIRKPEEKLVKIDDNNNIVRIITPAVYMLMYRNDYIDQRSGWYKNFFSLHDDYTGGSSFVSKDGKQFAVVSWCDNEDNTCYKEKIEIFDSQRRILLKSFEDATYYPKDDDARRTLSHFFTWSYDKKFAIGLKKENTSIAIYASETLNTSSLPVKYLDFPEFTLNAFTWALGGTFLIAQSPQGSIKIINVDKETETTQDDQVINSYNLGVSPYETYLATRNAKDTSIITIRSFISRKKVTTLEEALK